MDYRLQLLERHLFIELPEGLTLIDTGAPFSASVTGRLNWDGSDYPVYRGGYLGFTFAQLKSELGLEVRGLLGMDLLSRRSLHFSLAGEKLRVGSPLPSGWTARGYGAIPGTELPLFTARLNGLAAKVAWDTGAQFGYVTDPRFTAGLKPLPGFHDFSPLFGDLDPETSFELPVELDGHAFTEHVATAPERDHGGVSPIPMGPYLRFAGIDAVLGPGLLRTADLWIDPAGRLSALRPLTS
jgi:hypothetical protein